MEVRPTHRDITIGILDSSIDNFSYLEVDGIGHTIQTFQNMNRAICVFNLLICGAYYNVVENPE